MENTPEQTAGKPERTAVNAFVQFYRWVFGIGHERNVGGVERTIRYTLGGVSVLGAIGMFAFPVVARSAMNSLGALVLLVTGLYMIYEAQVQYCPLNHTIGRSTYDDHEAP